MTAVVGLPQHCTNRLFKQLNKKKKNFHFPLLACYLSNEATKASLQEWHLAFNFYFSLFFVYKMKSCESAKYKTFHFRISAALMCLPVALGDIYCSNKIKTKENIFILWTLN